MTDAAGPRWFFANLAQVRLSQTAAGGAMSIVELVGHSRMFDYIEFVGEYAFEPIL